MILVIAMTLIVHCTSRIPAPKHNLGGRGGAGYDIFGEGDLGLNIKDNILPIFLDSSEKFRK